MKTARELRLIYTQGMVLGSGRICGADCQVITRYRAVSGAVISSADSGIHFNAQEAPMRRKCAAGAKTEERKKVLRRQTKIRAVDTQVHWEGRARIEPHLA